MWGACDKSKTHWDTHLQFAGSFIITGDLQKVIYVYLHFWHLFLLKTWKHVLVSELLSVKMGVI